MFDDDDADALNVMTQRYSVRYLFVDHVDVDTSGENVDNLGTVVFANPAATIVAVG